MIYWTTSNLNSKINLTNYNLTPFSSFLGILDKIERNFSISKTLEEKIIILKNDIIERLDDYKKQSVNSDSVTLAIIRRVSRESVNTAWYIDEGARLLNLILDEVGFDIQIAFIDLMDRISLKILTRASYLQSENEFIWIFLHKPFQLNLDEYKDFSEARNNFIAHIYNILDRPKIISDERSFGNTNNNLEIQVESVTLLDIQLSLVFLKYDACILYINFYLKNNIIKNEEKSVLFKFKALSYLNIGEIDLCLEFLHLARSETKQNKVKAHISYLLGLVCAKRKYDLIVSDSYYKEGRAFLKEENDVLEYAWINNGFALNKIIRSKKDKDSQQEYFDEALDLVIEALDLIQNKNDDREIIYLRFNLIANITFLMEISKNYDKAIEIFTSVFNSEDLEKEKKKSVLTSFHYRIAMLKYKAGYYKESCDHLLISIKNNEQKIIGQTERILIPLILCLNHLGKNVLAGKYTSQLIGLVLDNRAGKQIKETFVVIKFLEKKGYQLEEKDLKFLNENKFDEIIIPEKIGDLNYLIKSKLPAYIPEIDLEDVPKYDLNSLFVNESIALV